MNTGTYIFSQVASLLPKRVFDGIVKKYGGDKYVKGYSCWNHLMVTMYGQLAGCSSLREFICIAHAHKSKCYHLSALGTCLRPTPEGITRYLKSSHIM